MNAREVNVMLTQAALLDPRMNRTDPGERAAISTAWAELLADVPLADALAAVSAHYSEQTRPIMPADILALSAEMPATGHTEPNDGRSWLLAHGIDPEEFEARIAAGERPARVLREHGIEVTA